MEWNFKDIDLDTSEAFKKDPKQYIHNALHAEYFIGNIKMYL